MIAQALTQSRVQDNKKVFMGYLAASATGYGTVYGLFKERAATSTVKKESYQILVDRVLKLYVDGSTTPVSYRFTKDDFADIENPTLAEVVAALAADTTFAAKVTASAELGLLKLVSVTSAGTSQIKVGDGDANPILGLLEGVDCDISANTLVFTVPYTEEALTSPPVLEVFSYNTSTGLATKVDIASAYTLTFSTVTGVITLTQAGSAITALVVAYF